MTTYAAITTLDGQGRADALAEALEAADPAPFAAGVFEVEDGSGLFEVALHFMNRPDETALALAAAAFGAKSFAISEIKPRDWVADVRRELTPVAAGRFLVHGGHDRSAAAGRRHTLEIEAAMAFGTGHHGTTRGCLLALDRLAAAGLRPRRVADSGCGTGVLAMAAASLWRRRAAAFDIDPGAVDTARANARANRLGPWLRVGRAAGFAAPALRAARPFDLIFANILARPLKRLAPDMARFCAPGGVVVLSGVLNRQRAGVEAVYRGWGFGRLWIGRDGEWSTLVLRRA
ncbi:MAG: 50S ribosomal protein L11 methyltransferase [Pseudomonadota bacterium]